MLKSYYREALVPDFADDIPDAATQQNNIRSGIMELVQQWRAIAAITAGCLALATVYVVLAPRQYRATALVSIDSKGDAVMRSAPAPLDFNVESANIDSQVEIMRAEQLFRQVAGTAGNDPALAAALQPLGWSLGTFLRGLLPWHESDAAEKASQTVQIARALEARTNAKRVGLTHLIEVSATMPDRDSAARVANAYASTFIADQTQRREDSARRTSQMLQARADELERKAEDAQRAVEQLKYKGSQQGETSASARVTLQTLESAAQTYRVLHDKFLERYAETWQQQFLSVPDAQIISQAYPPRGKSAPRTLLILAASLLVGVSLGTLAMLLRARLKGARPRG
jgi:uncharacterized protein involved in exopolysaccharide biosynthesis